MSKSWDVNKEYRENVRDLAGWVGSYLGGVGTTVEHYNSANRSTGADGDVFQQDARNLR